LELQFQKNEIPCLCTLLRKHETQEQTQEVRISDGMPDIGNILGSWGQVILRGKEWGSDSLTVSGGTMVWVQYIPEEGGAPKTVEAWIPFQMRWTIPPTQHDGVMLAQSLLKSVDSRSTSARKLMIRTNVSTLLHAMERCQKEIYSPVDLPEDVQINTVTYPILLPSESGEKAFAQEEIFAIQTPGAMRIIACNLQPQITETRIMGDKLVFRGNGMLSVLYEAEDGGQHTAEFDLPFSQYSELDQVYGDDAQALLWPAVTTLETELADGQLQVRAGLVVQYLIRHRPVVQVVADAYSPHRTVEPQYQQLQLPGILESKSQTLHVRTVSPVDGLRAVNVQMLPQLVTQQEEAERADLRLPVTFHALCCNLDGEYISHTEKCEEQITIPKAADARVEVSAWQVGIPQATMISGNLQMQAEFELQTEAVMDTGFPVVTGLILGEMQPPDPHRPSLILRRAGDRTLWQLAKESGSTVADIKRVNELQEEPDPEQMLLIPVR